MNANAACFYYVRLACFLSLNYAQETGKIAHKYGKKKKTIEFLPDEFLQMPTLFDYCPPSSHASLGLLPPPSFVKSVRRVFDI